MEKPIWGHGFATFPQNYMHYQTHYIADHPKASEILVSNNQFAFNEFIHIWCEEGIIGLLIVIIIVVLIIRYSYSQKKVFFSPFIGYLVFAFFSYPCSVMPLLLLLPIFLGNLSASMPIKRYLLPLTISFSFVIVNLVGVAILGFTFNVQYKLRNALSDYFYEEKEEERKLIEKNYSAIFYSKEFMPQYAKILYLKEEYELCIPILEQALVLYPTTEKYIDLGNCYQTLGKYTYAEGSYKYASKMLPALVYPRYCLFMLYQETGREKEAFMMAQQIMKMKVKNETQRILDIKCLLKRYINIENATKE